MVLAAANRASRARIAVLPSFYPQEIRIETLDPALQSRPGGRRRGFMRTSEMMLFGGGRVPADAAAAESLHSYLVLTFDAVYGHYAAASSNAQSAMRGRGPGFAAHCAGWCGLRLPSVSRYAVSRGLPRTVRSRACARNSSTRLRSTTRPLAPVCGFAPRACWRRSSFLHH